MGRTATIRTLGANKAPRASHPRTLRFFAEAITAAITPQVSQKTMKPPVILLFPCPAWSRQRPVPTRGQADSSRSVPTFQAHRPESSCFRPEPVADSRMGQTKVGGCHQHRRMGLFRYSGPSDCPPQLTPAINEPLTALLLFDAAGGTQPRPSSARGAWPLPPSATVKTDKRLCLHIAICCAGR